MSRRPFVIEQFRDLPGLAEIVGLGSVRQPFAEAQEVEIATLLSLTEDRADSDSASGTAIKWIGCGQLDLLVAGSRWRNGSPMPAGQSIRVSATFEAVRTEMIGVGAESQALNTRPFPSGPIATAPGFLLRRVVDPGDVEAGAGSSTGPELILLPHMELLRGLFGVSNDVLLELFDGIRNPAMPGGRGLIDRKRCHLRDDGTVVLAARRNLTREEALVVAALITDASLLKLHDSVFQQLSVKPEWRDGRPVYLAVAWPWKAPVHLELDGRWVERAEGRRRFICTRLVSLGIPMPFRRVEVHHPGSEQGNTDHLPPPSDRLRPTNARLFVLTTGRAASPSRRSVEVGTDSMNLPMASAIEVISLPHGGVSRNDRGQIGEESRDDAPFGTGGRKPGADTEVGAADIRRGRAGPGEVPARSHLKALAVTWDALAAACTRAGWALTALPISRGSSANARFGGLDLPREPLVAVVAAGGRRLLVVDRGSPLGDECSLGILVPANLARPDHQLAAAARRVCTSVYGRWRSRNLVTRDFRVTGINRPTEVWDDQDAYVNLLRRRVASALGL